MDANEKKIKNTDFTYNLITVAALLIFGIWMLIDSGAQEHLSVENAGVYFIKEIWSSASGLTILFFDLILFITSVVRYKTALRAKPTDLSFWVYKLSASLLLYTIALFAIIKLQTFMANSGVIATHFGHKAVSTINLIFITVIVVLVIAVAIFKLLSRAYAKK